MQVVERMAGYEWQLPVQDRRIDLKFNMHIRLEVFVHVTDASVASASRVNKRCCGAPYAQTKAQFPFIRGQYAVVYNTSIVLSLYTEYLTDDAALRVCGRYGCDASDVSLREYVDYTAGAGGRRLR